MSRRPPFWWKSSLFLLGGLTVGTTLVMGVSAPFLYGQAQELKELKQRSVKMEKYIHKHRELLAPEYVSPVPPSREELVQLQEQLPKEEEFPRFLIQLREATSVSGVRLTGIRFADSLEELEQYSKREKGEEGEKENSDAVTTPPWKDDLYLLPSIQYTSLVWADIFIEADMDQMKEFISQLGQLTRTVHVQEWDLYLPGTKGMDKRGNARVRLSLFMYHNPKLTDLPPLPELELGDGAGEEVQVSPEGRSDQKLGTENKQEKETRESPLPADADADSPYWWFPYPADGDLPEPLPGTKDGPHLEENDE